jgi:hypothetical protein
MDEDDQLSALNELLTAVWEKHVTLNENDPYRALARLNFPLYINTGVSNLLAEALRREGKQPQMAICPWNDAAYVEVKESFNISVERPLVYHMFGHLSQRESLVLTEDDYFDYLIGVTDNKKLIPHQIRAAITNQTTLIMGLSFNTWESRILFRVIMNQGGRRRRNRKTHLSAQIAPTKPDVDEPIRARRYLEEYFRNSAVNIFWGKPEDFIRSLKEKLDGAI